MTLFDVPTGLETKQPQHLFVPQPNYNKDPDQGPASTRPDGSAIPDWNNDGVVDINDVLEDQVRYPNLWEPADTGGGGGGYPPRTLAEDLEYLREQYKLSEEEKINVLVEQYELEGKSLEALEEIKQENKLAYLEEEVGLTLDMELELLKQKALDAGTLQDDQQEFERLMQSDQNDWKEEQNDLDRQLQEKLAAMDIASREALQAARLAAEQAMQQAGFTHAEKMQAAKQAFDKEMQERGFKHEEFMQERELAMRLTISNNEIAAQEKIAQKRIESEERMQEKGFAHEKEMEQERRKLDRQRMVVDMMKDNPVQAVLMAMGIGGNIPGGQGFEGLGPMEGAEELKTQTETALRGIEGVSPEASISESGVTGLAPVHKQARSFQRGSEAARTLLTSAHGITGAEQAGITPEEVQQRVQEVTPQGYQQRRAARGVGALPRLGERRPQQRPEPNTVYQTGEGEQFDGTRPEAIVTGDRAPTGKPTLEAIVPLTRPNEQVVSPTTTGGTITKYEEPYKPTGMLPSIGKIDPGTTTYFGPERGINIPPHETGKELPFGGGEIGTLPSPGGGRFAPPPEVMKYNQEIKQGIDNIFAEEGISREDFFNQMREAERTGTPLTPEQERIRRRIEEYSISVQQRFLAERQEREAALTERKVARDQMLRQRKDRYISSLPANEQRKIRQQEAIQSRNQAAKNIDLASFGPEVIRQLMEISSNPRSPSKPRADMVLSQMLPQIRNRGRITRAATGLTNILQ